MDKQVHKLRVENNQEYNKSQKSWKPEGKREDKIREYIVIQQIQYNNQINKENKSTVQ